MAASLAVQLPDAVAASWRDRFGAMREVFRSWGRGRGGDSTLDEMVLAYERPEEAREEFKAVPQGRIYYDTDWGPAESVDVSSFVLSASEAAVSCIGWAEFPDEEGCGIWAFRALYGKYVIEVSFRDDAGGARTLRYSKRDFLEIVRAVDAHVADVLK